MSTQESVKQPCLLLLRGTGVSPPPTHKQHLSKAAVPPPPHHQDKQRLSKAAVTAASENRRSEMHYQNEKLVEAQLTESVQRAMMGGEGEGEGGGGGAGLAAQPVPPPLPPHLTSGDSVSMAGSGGSTVGSSSTLRVSAPSSPELGSGSSGQALQPPQSAPPGVSPWPALALGGAAAVGGGGALEAAKQPPATASRTQVCVGVGGRLPPCFFFQFTYWARERGRMLPPYFRVLRGVLRGFQLHFGGFVLF